MENVGRAEKPQVEDRASELVSDLQAEAFLETFEELKRSSMELSAPEISSCIPRFLKAGFLSEAKYLQGLKRRLEVRESICAYQLENQPFLAPELDYGVVVTLQEHFEATRLRHKVFGEDGVLEGTHPEDKLSDVYYSVRLSEVPMFASLSDIDGDTLIQVDALDTDNRGCNSWMNDARKPIGEASLFTLYLTARTSNGELVAALRLTERKEFDGFIGDSSYPYHEVAEELSIASDELRSGAWLIDRACVCPDLRMRGVGSSLIQVAKEVVLGRGGLGIFAGINPLNTPSLAAFTRLGWRHYGDSGQREAQKIGLLFCPVSE